MASKLSTGAALFLVAHLALKYLLKMLRAVRQTIISLALFLLLLPSSGDGAPRFPHLSSLPGGAAVVVADLTTGDTVFEQNASSPVKPASVLKLVTTAAALHELGPDYRFRTELLIDREQKGVVDNLYVRGGGDPSLTMESLWLVARRLKAAGINRIGTLWIDDSAFVQSVSPQGQRAYETGSSAVSFNFNSIAIEVCPSTAGQAAYVTIDPWEVGVPVRGRIATIAKGMGQFSVDASRGSDISELGFAISGTFGVKRSCETVYRSIGDPALYLGTTLRALLDMLGVDVSSGPKVGTAPSGASLLHAHRSKPLTHILEDLNHYSNNFIGEQILFALGENSGKFDRQRGLSRMEQYLARLGHGSNEVSLHDGSGLSHSNRVSARAIMAVLREMHLNDRIGPEFLQSLSVSGRNGTLKKRSFGPPDILVRGKTGTLDGVVSLAGYVQGTNRHKYAFVIIQNGSTSRDSGHVNEKKLISAIHSLGS